MLIFTNNMQKTANFRFNAYHHYHAVALLHKREDKAKTEHHKDAPQKLSDHVSRKPKFDLPDFLILYIASSA